MPKNVFEIYDGRTSFWQWDVGQKIIVSDDIDCDEVHYCNGTKARAPRREVYELDGKRVAEVPDDLLQSSAPLKVYAYVSDSNGGRTIRSTTFSVTPKTMPDDYVYTEHEVQTWEILKQRIEELEKELADTFSRLIRIDLPASSWEGDDGLYSQVLAIDGITAYSKVDLLPSVEQLAIFHNKDVAFITENDNGVVTIYAIGDKPLLDYSMQAQITEVMA